MGRHPRGGNGIQSPGCGCLSSNRQAQLRSSQSHSAETQDSMARRPGPTLVRGAQVAMVTHGTCLIIAGLMLLAAASGQRPLLPWGAAMIGASSTATLGLLLLALPCTLTRGRAGWSILIGLECLAFATSIVLFFPVLVAIGAAASGAVALVALRGRADNSYYPSV